MENTVDLVHRASEGDQKSFEQIVHAYEGAVRRVAWQILGNSDDADDVAQETWLTVWRRLPALRDPNLLGGWLYRIAANAALRKRQQRLSRYVGTIAFAKLEKGLLMTPPQSPDSSGSDSSYRVEMLSAALEALSGRDRLVLGLHHFSGMDLTEIAQLLGTPTGTIKSRLFHARQKIRKEMETMTGPARRPEHVPVDFRKVIGDQDGKKPWTALFREDLQGWWLHADQKDNRRGLSSDAMPQNWKLVPGGFVGEEWNGGTCLAAGDASWKDYELSLLITPIAGGNAQVIFRVDDAGRGFYVLDMMMGWQTVDVHRIDIGADGQHRLIRLSVVDYPLEAQREYAVKIAPRGGSITTYVDGALVNQVTDDTYRSGGIGLNVWESKTLFRDIQVRHLHVPESAA